MYRCLYLLGLLIEQVKGKLYPVDVYSVAPPLRHMEGGAQAEPSSGRRGRKQRRAGTQGLATASGPAALSGSRTRSTDTISKIKFKQMVGRHHEIEQVCNAPLSFEPVLLAAATAASQTGTVTLLPSQVTAWYFCWQDLLTCKHLTACSCGTQVVRHSPVQQK